MLVVSPVHNESAHIARVVEAVARQRRPPDVWIVVDDGSDDGTLDILQTLEADVPFMRVVALPSKREHALSRDRLAAASDSQAFNAGLRTVELRSFAYIGKLDGDIELPSDYFDRLLAQLERDAQLGLAGGNLVEIGRSGWKRLAIPSHHVHGALKLYTRECFESIGGVRESLAWDTIDETYARMKGYSTRSFPDIVARHLKPWGSADGRLRGCARHGECAYIVHFPLLWVLLRSLKVALARPPALSGVSFLYGYLRAAARSTPRVDDPTFRRFVRRELRRRLLGRASVSAREPTSRRQAPADAGVDA